LRATSRRASLALFIAIRPCENVRRDRCRPSYTRDRGGSVEGDLELFRGAIDPLWILRMSETRMNNRVLTRFLIAATFSLVAPSLGDSAGTSDPEMRTVPTIGDWRRIDRSGGPGTAAPAFLRTADVDHSDPRLAGLMLHCNGNRIEAVFVVVAAFPPHVRPRITLRVNEEEAYFDATVIQAGTGLAIPAERLTSMGGTERAAEDLVVHIGPADTGFGGIVRATGLKSVVNSLAPDCARNK
jgi:hypothetical protein